MKKATVWLGFFLLGLVLLTSSASAQQAGGRNQDRPRGGAFAPRRSNASDNDSAIPPTPPATGAIRPAEATAPSAAATGKSGNNSTGTETADSKPAPVSDGSEFIVPPNATPDELMAFAEKLTGTEREFNTEEEYKAWISKMIQTVFMVAGKILASDGITDELYAKATDLKGEMIYSHGMNDPKSFPVYEQFVLGAIKDPRLQKTEAGKTIADSHLAGYLHWGCTRTVQTNGSVDDLKKYVDLFQEIVLRNPKFVEMMPELIYPVGEMAQDKKDSGLLKEVFGPLAKTLKEANDKTLQDAAAGLEGILRFAELKGHPFAVVGTLANGKEFDASIMKGKIVLVNFWGTWVTPCLAQYPDLLALYVQYHDQGFEIIGYSVDEDVDKLNDYLTTKKVLWPNISEVVSEKNKQPSLTEFYGITGVPTLILLDREGKVLESDIEMESLQKTLAELFK